MGTKGKKWTRKDKRMNKEAVEWLKSICPAKEHGYKNRDQIWKDFNRRFNTNYSFRGFCSHLYEEGIQLGFINSLSDTPRGVKHWRHRPVGTLRLKKGYWQIKVAEPSKWMQYSRYVWEKNHPGESAEGKRIIFMDSNVNNFDPDNLECVTAGEQALMNQYGCRADTPRDEKEIILLRARLTRAKYAIFGPVKSQILQAKIKRDKVKDTPEYKEKIRERYQLKMERIKADPVLYQAFLEKNRRYKELNKDRYREIARNYARRKRERLKAQKEQIQQNLDLLEGIDNECND